jgi:hypothetical protein
MTTLRHVACRSASLGEFAINFEVWRARFERHISRTARTRSIHTAPPLLEHSFVLGHVADYWLSLHAVSAARRHDLAPPPWATERLAELRRTLGPVDLFATCERILLRARRSLDTATRAPAKNAGTTRGGAIRHTHLTRMHTIRAARRAAGSSPQPAREEP